MKISRHDLLKVGLATTAAGFLGAACSDDPAGTGTGTGGSGTGGGKNTGGSGTGGSSTGGKANTGGTSTGGASSTTGGATNNTGGASVGTGGANNTGGNSSAGMCAGNVDCDVADSLSGHKHNLMISAADINAGVAMTFMTLDEGTHQHEVMLTANHMTTLKGGGTVTVNSDGSAQSLHIVTIMCA